MYIYILYYTMLYYTILYYTVYYLHCSEKGKCSKNNS